MKLHPYFEAHAMHCSAGEAEQVTVALPRVPISGDKMALELCQVLLAEPGAAAAR